MRVSILLQITNDDGAVGSAEEVAAFEKATERPETVGLSLADGKALLAAVQHRVVQCQAVEWAGRHRCCASCGSRRRSNGSYPVLFRTLIWRCAAFQPKAAPLRVPGQGRPGDRAAVVGPVP